jgi:exonuclease III
LSSHPACGRKSIKSRTRALNIATWNVRTLSDSKNTMERRTALICRELAKYDIDIAALSETRLPDESQLEEVAAGYTIYWRGKPATDKRQAGVGFAVKSSIANKLESVPQGLSDRLMTLRLRLSTHHHATLISAYAPTMSYPDDVKESFYEELGNAIRAVPRNDKLILLGDFNARVGRDHQTWPGVLGCHGLGKENDNGTLLLSLCATHQLTVTNTAFQQANKRKATWMHPRSGHWHLIDYIIVRQRDKADVMVTRAIRGAEMWSDHRLVRAKMRLRIKPLTRPRRTAPHRKLDVAALKSEAISAKFEADLSEALDDVRCSEAVNVEEAWSSFKKKVLESSANTLGFVQRKHQDWFDENDSEIQGLLDQVHAQHTAWINDKKSSSKHSAYKCTKQKVQARLRDMKDSWWKQKAEALQQAADRKDSKSFFDGLKAVYGPRSSGSTPIYNNDESLLLTDKSQILERWAEHFDKVLNCQSSVSSEALDDIEQLPLLESLSNTPSLDEVTKAVKQMSSGKAAGPDGIPSEVYKHGGQKAVRKLTSLFRKIWREETVPQEFRDAIITHLYKRKGNRASCDNHRGISLLATAGKILARVMLNRLIEQLVDKVLPESQCGFRSGRSTVDMVFIARHIQEKCREQQQDLYIVFIDLTKAFDSVNRDGLWQILGKLGCPAKFVNIVKSFHTGMEARVLDQGSFSNAFTVSNGVKQGCVLAPTLFSIMFAMLIRDAFKDVDKAGIFLQYRTDGGVFNLQRFRAKTKVMQAVSRELLFADDCALMAHSLEHILQLTDCFAKAAKRFGLTISLKKTEVVFQPRSAVAQPKPTVLINDTPLHVVDNFCYLGSVMSQDAEISDDIKRRIAAAGTAFGRLEARLWCERGIRLATKVAVYKAVVLATLLYGCESWTMYRRHVRSLEQFHMRCLRHISKIKWHDKIPNTEVLSRCGTTGVEAFIIRAQLRWIGHVSRMPASRLPKTVFYSELQSGSRPRGRPKKRFRDNLKVYMQSTDIDPNSWETIAAERSEWRRRCTVGVQHFEEDRIANAEDKRKRRKDRAAESGSTTSLSHSHICDVCGRQCAAKIGLISHMRTHRK